MQPTRDTSTLDLIFIDMVENMVEYYEIPAILTPLSTSDHNVINWKSKCNIAEKGNLTKIKVRQFQQQQLEQFDALLANYIIGPSSLTPLALIEKSILFYKLLKI